MDQEEVARLNAAKTQQQTRSRLLNNIFIINLILSTAGFWQVYRSFTEYSSCHVSGWFGSFTILIDLLMSSSLFIFVFIRKTRETKNYFAFVLLSNIQIVFRFIYLNQIVLIWMDYRNGIRDDCWITTWRMVESIVFTVIVIVVYFLAGSKTTIYINYEINFKFSHHTGFMKRGSRLQ